MSQLPRTSSNNQRRRVFPKPGTVCAAAADELHYISATDLAGLGETRPTQDSPRPPKTLHFGEFDRDAENVPPPELLADKRFTASGRMPHPQENSPLPPRLPETGESTKLQRRQRVRCDCGREVVNRVLKRNRCGLYSSLSGSSSFTSVSLSLTRLISLLTAASRSAFFTFLATSPIPLSHFK